MSGNQEGQEHRLPARTRRCVLTHTAVGGVEDAGVHGDDGTRRRKSHHTCTAMPTGGSTHNFLKRTNRRANWPDSAEACMDREMQRQSGEPRGQQC